MRNLLGGGVIPDIRPNEIKTIEETYTTPEGTNESASYKALNLGTIIGNLFHTAIMFFTHASAVWYNKLANRTVKDEIDDLKNRLTALEKKVSFTAISHDLVTDCDNITEPGFYCNLLDSGQPNGPGLWGYLLVFRYQNIGNVTQLFIPYNHDYIYTRYKYAGVWSQWAKH